MPHLPSLVAQSARSEPWVSWPALLSLDLSVGLWKMSANTLLSDILVQRVEGAKGEKV